jgi:hypothetical protein
MSPIQPDKHVIAPTKTAMSVPLPDERDFDPSGHGLDEQHAWRNFGGLTLEEAHRKFRECPEVYQEDFMWMGGVAFAYYFPVVDSFLREAAIVGSLGEDRQAWILAHCLKMQFSGEVATQVRQLADRVLDLTGFVQSNIALFAPDDVEEQREIADAWQVLKDLIGKQAGR